MTRWLQLSGVFAVVLATACASQGSDAASVAPAAADQAAAVAIPSLSGKGLARDRVRDFVAWAANSKIGDTDELHRQLDLARNDREVVDALALHADESTDHSDALLTLALLGEMRSPYAIEHFRAVIARPLPAFVGEGTERAGVEMLESKAVDGLAYLRDAKADAEVLRVAATHESRAVRAEAIDAYLYNHDDSEAARATLAATVQPADRIFIDRPRHVEGETAEAFDKKLEVYLAQHPEIVPPAVASVEVPR